MQLRFSSTAASGARQALQGHTEPAATARAAKTRARPPSQSAPQRPVPPFTEAKPEAAKRSEKEHALLLCAQNPKS